MGNKLGRRRQVVDEQYTRPQGLYHLKELDPKKLKKLILDSKLAPCYPGAEEGAPDLEECPICFLYYPSLNRSRCCTKGICTECLLQMKPPHSTRPTQCPFCKTSNYAVEYRGFRTKEEKGMEQIEEQKVIEAKIRMRQQELQDEEERRMQRRQEMGSSSRIMTPEEAEYRDMSSSSDNAVPSFSFPAQSDEIIPSPDSGPMSGNSYPAHARQNREDEFDLEELMVMEAIWRSIQEQETYRSPVCGDTTASEPSVLEDPQVSMVGASSESSPSSGLPCAVAALSKRQHMDDENSIANVSRHVPAYMLPQDSGPSYPAEGVAESYQPESWIEVSPESGRALPMEGGEWAVDHGSEVAEAGTSYASSDTAVDAGATSALNEGVGDVFQPPMAGILPDSFEEQMMLAMAVSQVEARARTSYPGLAWY